jgi:hypothetical protein
MNVKDRINIVLRNHWSGTRRHGERSQNGSMRKEEKNTENARKLQRK